LAEDRGEDHGSGITPDVVVIALRVIEQLEEILSGFSVLDG
jgi:hypothetical protein